MRRLFVADSASEAITVPERGQSSCKRANEVLLRIVHQDEGFASKSAPSNER